MKQTYTPCPSSSSAGRKRKSYSEHTVQEVMAAIHVVKISLVVSLVVVSVESSTIQCKRRFCIPIMKGDCAAGYYQDVCGCHACYSDMREPCGGVFDQQCGAGLKCVISYGIHRGICTAIESRRKDLVKTHRNTAVLLYGGNDSSHQRSIESEKSVTGKDTAVSYPFILAKAFGYGGKDLINQRKEESGTNTKRKDFALFHPAALANILYEDDFVNQRKERHEMMAAKKDGTLAYQAEMLKSLLGMRDSKFKLETENVAISPSEILKIPDVRKTSADLKNTSQSAVHDIDKTSDKIGEAKIKKDTK